jgi:hypothetical protein
MALAEDFQTLDVYKLSEAQMRTKDMGMNQVRQGKGGQGDDGDGGRDSPSNSNREAGRRRGGV